MPKEHILTFSIGQDKIVRSEQYRHNITGYNTSLCMSEAPEDVINLTGITCYDTSTSSLLTFLTFSRNVLVIFLSRAENDDAILQPSHSVGMAECCVLVLHAHSGLGWLCP